MAEDHSSANQSSSVDPAVDGNVTTSGPAVLIGPNSTSTVDYTFDGTTNPNVRSINPSGSANNTSGTAATLASTSTTTIDPKDKSSSVAVTSDGATAPTDESSIAADDVGVCVGGQYTPPPGYTYSRIGDVFLAAHQLSWMEERLYGTLQGDVKKLSRFLLDLGLIVRSGDAGGDAGGDALAMPDEPELQVKYVDGVSILCDKQNILFEIIEKLQQNPAYGNIQIHLILSRHNLIADGGDSSPSSKRKATTSPINFERKRAKSSVAGNAAAGGGLPAAGTGGRGPTVAVTRGGADASIPTKPSPPAVAIIDKNAEVKAGGDGTSQGNTNASAPTAGAKPTTAAASEDGTNKPVASIPTKPSPPAVAIIDKNAEVKAGGDGTSQGNTNASAPTAGGAKPTNAAASEDGTNKPVVSIPTKPSPPAVAIIDENAEVKAGGDGTSQGNTNASAPTAGGAKPTTAAASVSTNAGINTGGGVLAAATTAGAMPVPSNNATAPNGTTRPAVAAVSNNAKVEAGGGGMSQGKSNNGLIAHQGVLKEEGQDRIIHGLWAFNSLDSGHGFPEFRHKHTAGEYPSGQYNGSLYLRDGETKFEKEDAMDLTFAKNQDGSFAVQGEGSNYAGVYTITGSLVGETFKMFRKYVSLSEPAGQRLSDFGSTIPPHRMTKDFLLNYAATQVLGVDKGVDSLWLNYAATQVLGVDKGVDNRSDTVAEESLLQQAANKVKKSDSNSVTPAAEKQSFDYRKEVCPWTKASSFKECMKTKDAEYFLRGAMTTIYNMTVGDLRQCKKNPQMAQTTLANSNLVGKGTKCRQNLFFYLVEHAWDIIKFIRDKRDDLVDLWLTIGDEWKKPSLPPEELPVSTVLILDSDANESEIAKVLTGNKAGIDCESKARETKAQLGMVVEVRDKKKAPTYEYVLNDSRWVKVKKHNMLELAAGKAKDTRHAALKKLQDAHMKELVESDPAFVLRLSNETNGPQNYPASNFDAPSRVHIALDFEPVGTGRVPRTLAGTYLYDTRSERDGMDRCNDVHCQFKCGICNHDGTRSREIPVGTTVFVNGMDCQNVKLLTQWFGVYHLKPDLTLGCKLGCVKVHPTQMWLVANRIGMIGKIPEMTNDMKKSGSGWEWINFLDCDYHKGVVIGDDQKVLPAKAGDH